MRLSSKDNCRLVFLCGAQLTRHLMKFEGSIRNVIVVHNFVLDRFSGVGSGQLAANSITEDDATLGGSRSTFCTATKRGALPRMIEYRANRDMVLIGEHSR